MRRNRFFRIFLLGLLILGIKHLQAQTLQVALSPAPKVNRTTSGGTATIFFDSNIEDLSIICTEENPNEVITKINDHQWFVNIDVNKDIEADGICYRNYLLKCSASAEFFLTTAEITPNQVLYYTITLPNELEPKLIEKKYKLIAEKAKNGIANGDTYGAILALLTTIPEESERSINPEIECALRVAYDSIQNRKWNWRFIGYCEYDKVSDNENYIAILKDDKITVLDATTLNISSTVFLDDNLHLTFFSLTDNYLICIFKEGLIKYYKLPICKLEKTIHLNDNSYDDIITNNLYRIRYHDDNKIQKKYLSLLGLSDDVEVLDYNKKRNLALIKENYKRDNEEYYTVALYDCEKNKRIYIFDNDGESFNEFERSGYGGIWNAFFSHDGGKIVISYINGGGTILDVNTISRRDFSCGQEDCCHYSNFFRFGYNNQLLHSSRFESGLKIIDMNSLSVVDSIILNKDLEIFYANMNSKGNRCFIQAENELYMCYLSPKDTSVNSKREDFVSINRSSMCSDTIILGRYHIECKDNGFYFHDMNNEYKDWNVFCQYGFRIINFIQNNKYIVIDCISRFGTDFRIMDLVSGVEMFCNTEWGELYYNGLTEQLMLKKDIQGKNAIYNFPSCDNLLLKCKNVTKGMHLSDYEKLKYSITD